MEKGRRKEAISHLQLFNSKMYISNFEFPHSLLLLALQSPYFLAAAPSTLRSSWEHGSWAALEYMPPRAAYGTESHAEVRGQSHIWKLHCDCACCLKSWHNEKAASGSTPWEGIHWLTLTSASGEVILSLHCVLLFICLWNAGKMLLLCAPNKTICHKWLQAGLISHSPALGGFAGLHISLKPL